MRYLKKLLLNLIVLSLEITLILVCIKAFTGKLPPVVGATSIVGILVCLYILINQVQNKYLRYRRPGMFKTTLSVMLIIIIAALAGCQPLATYKDILFDKIGTLIKTAQATTPTPEIIKPPTPTPIPTMPKPTEIKDYQTLFNHYRHQNGLPALIFTEDLNANANLRLEELKTNFSHNSAGGYNARLAENIVKGIYSDQSALSVWSNSSGHKANMLNSSYKYTGYAIGKGYAIQLFTSYQTINGEPQPPLGWHWNN